MILFTYFNQDGYITQIINAITKTFERMGITYRLAYGHDMVRVAKECNPHLLLCYHPPYDFENYLADIQSISCHKLLWESETPFEIDVVKKGKDNFHYNFIMDANAQKALQREFPGNEYIHVPCAMSPDVHKQYDVGWEYRSDLVFIGAPFPSRIAFFNEVKEFLEDYYVTIIGFGWNGNVNFGPNVRVINNILPDHECMKFYSGAKVALNLQRQMSDSWGHNNDNIAPSSPANRMFEIAGTGTCQMVDNTRYPEMWKYFAKDELIMFDGSEGFKILFNEIVSDKIRRQKIGKKAKDRVLEAHTYEKRIEQFLLRLLDQK